MWKDRRQNGAEGGGGGSQWFRRMVRMFERDKDKIIEWMRYTTHIWITVSRMYVREQTRVKRKVFQCVVATSSSSAAAAAFFFFAMCTLFTCRSFGLCVCTRLSSFLCLRFASPNNNVPTEWIYLEVKSFYTNRKFILYIFSRQVFIYSIWRYNDQTFRLIIIYGKSITLHKWSTGNCLMLHTQATEREKEILIWQNGKGICRLVVMTTASGSRNVYNGEMKTVDSVKWKQFRKGKHTPKRKRKNRAILHASALPQLSIWIRRQSGKANKKFRVNEKNGRKASHTKNEEDAENRWSCRRKSIDK